MTEKNEIKSAIEAARNSSNAEITELVEQWLANKWCVPPGFVDDFFEMQISTYFLLVWPIFEHDVCDGFMETGKILDVARKFGNCYDEMDIDVILKKFYERYKDRNSPNSNWNGLCHDDSSRAKSNAERVLNIGWNRSDSVAKLQFGLYVIYRFRNNIFHGNKQIFEWLHNREQIEDCIRVLLSLTVFYEKTKKQKQ